MQLFKVSSNKKIADDICVLKMKPQEGGIFAFKPGQFVMIHLLDENGKTVRKSPFSIASPPCESDFAFDFGVRVNGPVSSALFNSAPGDVFGVQGPYGTFNHNESAEKIVFLAAGIGITPFRSMIRQALLAGSRQQLVLLQSARSVDHLAYQDEFMDLMLRYKNFSYIPILTRNAPENWTGAQGRLNMVLLEQSVGDFANAEFMVCGPSAFMNDSVNLLRTKGVEPERLRLERY